MGERQKVVWLQADTGFVYRLEEFLSLQTKKKKLNQPNFIINGNE